MKVIDFVPKKKPVEPPKPTKELQFYQDLLWSMARYLQDKDITCESVNMLFGMLSLSMAKLTVSAEHIGIEVLVENLVKGIERDIDKEMEKYLTTDDYKLYFETEE